MQTKVMVSDGRGTTSLIIFEPMIGHYELLYILPGNLTDEEAQAASEAVRKLLIDQGAAVSKSEYWGKRKLAHEINHHRHGFYDLVEFDLETGTFATLDQALRLHEQVMRYQIVTRTIKTPEQLAAEKQLQDRLAAKRQAQKERETAAAMAESKPQPDKPAEEKEVSGEVLEQKLEEILDEDKVDV